MWRNVSQQTVISMQTSFFPPTISYTTSWISETYCANDNLQYPLIFCNGEDGYYTQYIPKNDMKIKALLINIVSATDWYSYRIMEHDGKECYLLLFHNLFNQILVNMLQWQELMACYHTSERWLCCCHLLPQDLAICMSELKIWWHKCAISDGQIRFIIFTCNQKWPEILMILKQG